MSKCIDPEHGNLLHLYELNGLSKQDTDRFEIHLLKCEYCFNELNEFVENAETIRNSIYLPEEVEKSLDREDYFDPIPESIWRRIWPPKPFRSFAVVSYLLIILLAIPSFFGIKQIIDAREKIEPIQMISLTDSRASQRAAFRTSPGIEGVIVFLVPSALPGKKYQITIITDAGDEIMRDDNFDRLDEFGIGKLSFPRTLMKHGGYRLIILDQAADSVLSRYEYRFQIID
jgi:hypothetical protein